MRSLLRTLLLAILLNLPALALAGALLPDRLAAAAEPLSATDRQLYRQAFQLAERGQWTAALALSAQASEPLPGKVLRWEWLRRDERADFAAIASFLDENPDWPGSEQLQRRAERAMPPSLPDAVVIAWFAGREPQTAEGHIRYAEALARRGLTDEAVATARKAWRELPLGRDLEERLQARFAGAFTREDHEARLTAMLLQRADGSAINAGRRLGSGYLALAEATVKLYNRAAGVDGAVARVPAELRDHPRLVYERARWRLRSGLLDGALDLLDAPHPPDAEPDNWWALRRWAARDALEEGRVSQAYRVAAQHGTTDGLSFAEGEFLAGWIALRFLQDDRAALAHFERLYEGVGSPISRARGAYWAGEAERTAGNEGKAQAWYRLAGVHDTTFYGLLAIHRLGGRPEAVELPKPAPSAQRRATFEARELTRAIRYLAELGATDPLPWLFAALRSAATDEVDWRLIGELAEEIGRREQVVRTAKLAMRDGIFLPDLLFPPPPRALGQDLDSALVAGLMRQESEFNTEAVSPAGARGLMQLMPGTAREVAVKLGLGYSLSLLTEDPDYNMRLGRAYLSRLLSRTGGYVPLAVAGYNAGPGNVDKWLRRYGDPRDGSADPIDWMESIPFSETRNYVQRVIEGAVVYARQMGLGGDPIAAFVYRPQTGLGDGLSEGPAAGSMN